MHNTSDPGRPKSVVSGGTLSAAGAPYVPSTADYQPWMDEGRCLGWHCDPRDRHMSEARKRELQLEWIDLPAQSAKRVCLTCPVIQQCQEWALKLRPLPDDGVWGGLSHKQLRAKAHRLAVNPFPEAS